MSRSCAKSTNSMSMFAMADDRYTDEETRRRAEAALRAAFKAPHKPQSEMKLGKPTGKSEKSSKRSKATTDKM